MKDPIHMSKRLTLAAMLAAGLILPSLAQADGGRHHWGYNHRGDHRGDYFGDHRGHTYRSHDRDHGYHRGHGRGYPPNSVVLSLPHGHISFSFGRDRFYAADGRYYRRAPHGYVLVAPPIGAIVNSIPRDCIIQRRGSRVYYVYDGAYYVPVARGYQVVDAPDTMIVQNSSDLVPLTSPEVVTINIPNRLGKYTPVTLKKSGQGFVGPQGEFYAKFPTVEELKVVYGSQS